MQVVYDVDELLWRLKYTRDFFVRDADKAQRVEKCDTEEVVSVNLRPTDLVPRSLCRVTFDGRFTVDTRRLIQAEDKFWSIWSSPCID